QEEIKLFFTQVLVSSEHLDQLIRPLGTHFQVPQQTHCHLIESEARICPSQQHTQVASSVEAWQCAIEAIELVAENVRVLVRSVDSCPRAIQMLPRRTGETCLD